MSQGRTVLSLELDASSRPSGEKATDLTGPEWPSRACNSALHLSLTCGSWHIQLGRSGSNSVRIIAALGANINPAQ
ncbi:uncharacterized protein BJX67DRAFT_368556 [Aspergillus lucknowensis]|uniref:Uncharacterized protein n=1 Tax=Aspergillus lucknowensis TaxID=176173 RepID=A0ABR4L6U9_9EURO